MRLCSRIAVFLVSVLQIAFVYTVNAELEQNEQLHVQLNAQTDQLDSSLHKNSVEFRRAKFNYQMLCQGCHSPDGTGHKSVPDLRDSMAQFMRFKEGREFMVRVPGSANSVLSDAHLAEVLNWMTNEFSAQLSKSDWLEYSAEEVSEYRQNPLLQTEPLRAELIKRFSTTEVSNTGL